MKYIMFANEIFKFPENGCFWIDMKELLVNLSKDFAKGNYHSYGFILLSESYETGEECEDRLHELLGLLNEDNDKLKN